MKITCLILVALGSMFAIACSPSQIADRPTVQSSTNNAGLAANSTASPASPFWRTGNLISHAPEAILEQTALAFGRVKSFRVRETLEPVNDTLATFEIEVLVPDKERGVSRGECPYGLGESIVVGKVQYQRCGTAKWLKSHLSWKGTVETYEDYLRNSYPFALNSPEFADHWEVRADYVVMDAPPGTVTWSIGKGDFMPRKLVFITDGYVLVSEFRDFDRVTTPASFFERFEIDEKQDKR